ncbi:zinc finger BED domain-containing protein RICESLEEPER 1-like [Amaranthus tricolor]|uniref:zinc finger BED domain-containing protein RICESLEEPER 1-like n=1 Tax=Amaranthus tricolor TaxID=29722 RepID=UPI00258C5F15|nr:zinc finger BED domain-containing protein RICESLEEPER 1-like [Amaranthus tricolor]
MAVVKKPESCRLHFFTFPFSNLESPLKLPGGTPPDFRTSSCLRLQITPYIKIFGRLFSDFRIFDDVAEILSVKHMASPSGSSYSPIDLDSTANNREEDSISNEDNVQAINNQGRKLKSLVWQHMKRDTLIDGSVQATCKYCDLKFNASHSSGTSHLKRHIDKCPKRMNRDLKNLLLGRSPLSGDSNISLKNPIINFEEVRKGIHVFIVAGAHSFSTCEEPGFKYMVSQRCPQFSCISRHTLKRDIFRHYNEEKVIVKDELKKAPGRICLTADNWKSEHTDDEYMCITAHWVDANWKLQKRIIKFGALTPPFDGISLADEVALCLSEWKIDHKVLSFTVDNASYNDCMITFLKNHLDRKNSLYFDGQFFHLRCGCHIINLVVQAGLKSIDGVVAKIKKVVKHYKHSIPKKKKFYSVAETSFGIKTKRKLRGDNNIRWNSTFLMLDRYIFFRDVIDHVVSRDKDLSVFALSKDEWDKVIELHGFLKIFYDVTNSFSASKTPTSNLYFDGVWKIHRKLIEIMDGDNSSCGLAAMIKDMKTKFDKYWSDCNVILSLAAVLDPRFKLDRVEYCYQKLYGESYAREKVELVKSTLFCLFDEYRDQICAASSHNLGTSGTADFPTIVSCVTDQTQMEEDLDYKVFLSKKRKVDDEKTELELYLEEKTLDFSSKFDVLAYWSTRVDRYPHLACLARDILAMPISTVPSESVFSMGKKLINPWRASLGQKTIETYSYGPILIIGFNVKSKCLMIVGN